MDKRLFPGLLAALFLTGCTNNYPPVSPGGGRRIARTPVTPPDLPDVTTADSKGKASDLDSVGAADKPSSESAKDIVKDDGKLDDPLSGGTTEVGSDPFVDNYNGGGLTDKTSADDDYDPLAGPRMPTKHSHWLSVGVGKAKVALTLNGVGQGTFVAGFLRDYTMKMRPGLNILVVTYTPQDVNSYASISMVEGEHDPPIAPLVNFQQFPLKNSYHSPEQVKQLLRPVTRTFTFITQ